MGLKYAQVVNYTSETFRRPARAGCRHVRCYAPCAVTYDAARLDVAQNNEGENIPIRENKTDPGWLVSSMKQGALRVAWSRRTAGGTVRGGISNEACRAAPITEKDRLIVDRNIAEWPASNRTDARHRCDLVIT